MNKTILFLLFTQISLAQIFSATSLNRRNFDPTELTVKFKNNVKDNVYDAKSKKVESFFNMGQLGEIKDNSTEKQQNINIVSNVFTSNYLTITDINVLKNTSSKIAINLANNENIRGLQFDLNIPEGFTFDIENVVETSTLNNFTTSISSLGNNHYRFIIYTISNEYIVSGDNTILRLPIFIENTIDAGQYTFEFSNVVLSSEANQNISSEAQKIGYINVIEDTIAPVITLLGDASVTVQVGSTYNDTGATASDNYDGDITESIVTVNNVDTDTVGTYTITYNVKDTSSNSAEEVTRTVIVASSLSIEDDPMNDLNISPNPTQNYWKISSSVNLESIELFDVVGRKIFSVTPSSKNFKINGSSLSNGVYFLILNKKNRRRLIKN